MLAKFYRCSGGFYRSMFCSRGLFRFCPWSSKFRNVSQYYGEAVRLFQQKDSIFFSFLPYDIEVAGMMLHRSLLPLYQLYRTQYKLVLSERWSKRSIRSNLPTRVRYHSSKFMTIRWLIQRFIFYNSSSLYDGAPHNQNNQAMFWQNLFIVANLNRASRVAFWNICQKIY